MKYVKVYGLPANIRVRLLEDKNLQERVQRNWPIYDLVEKKFCWPINELIQSALHPSRWIPKGKTIYIVQWDDLVSFFRDNYGC